MDAMAARRAAIKTALKPSVNLKIKSRKHAPARRSRKIDRINPAHLAGKPGERKGKRTPRCTTKAADKAPKVTTIDASPSGRFPVKGNEEMGENANHNPDREQEGTATHLLDGLVPAGISGVQVNHDTAHRHSEHGDGDGHKGKNGNTWSR